MDAARAVMGHGWPFSACPRSNDGVREVSRSETRMSGACFFCLLFFARAKKSEAPERAQHARTGDAKAAVKRKSQGHYSMGIASLNPSYGLVICVVRNGAPSP